MGYVQEFIDKLELRSDDFDVPVRDLTSDQLARVMRKGNEDRYVLENSLISGFFGSSIKYSESKDLTSYENNIMQNVLFDYMDEIGFKLVDSCAFKNDAIWKSPIQNKQYYGEEVLVVYSDAILFFEDPKNTLRKYCINIKIDEYNRNFIDCAVYSSIEDVTLRDILDYAKKHNFYKGMKVDAHAKHLHLDNEVNWDDVILPENILECAKNNVFELFKVSKILAENNIAMKRGVIFSGPPGVGKTMLIKSIINHVDSTVIYVLPSHIKNIKDINLICEMAKDLAPTLLVIEDIDYIAEDRNDSQLTGLAIELMNKLDGLESMDGVITLASTNMVEKIENAIKNRPGRFDRVIRFDEPNEECRLKMLYNFTKNCKLEKDVNLEKIAQKTKGMTGAYIKDLCNYSAMLAAIEGSYKGKKKKIYIARKHFVQALKEVSEKDFSTYREELKEKNSKVGFVTEMESEDSIFNI